MMDRKISLYVIELRPFCRHNVLVPETMRTETAAALILDLLAVPHAKNCTERFISLDGRPLDAGLTLRECGLTDGSQLAVL